jgi:hypothetical protein
MSQEDSLFLKFLENFKNFHILLKNGVVKTFTKIPKRVKACANNKCNLITLGGVNEVVLIALKVHI